jgi:hypothetical protein
VLAKRVGLRRSRKGDQCLCHDNQGWAFNTSPVLIAPEGEEGGYFAVTVQAFGCARLKIEKAKDAPRACEKSRNYTVYRERR